MVNLIISIKPEYVKLIKEGKKIYEFRKQKIRKVNDIFVYETRPTKKVTLIMNFEEYIEGTPKEIWDKCQKHAGISKKDFFNYYKNKKIAYAYKIKLYKKVNIELKEILPNAIPPQSFRYI